MTEPWALVLGASSGVGAEIARRLARSRGLNVAGVHRGRHAAEADAVVAELESIRRQAAFWQIDAGTAEAAEDGARRLLALAGPRSVKVVVHSLAGASVGSLAAGGGVRPDQVHRTFDRLAHSFLFWTHALHAADLLAPSARILGLTNPMPGTVLRNTGLIAAAKAALEVYMRHLAFELGPLGHRVNLVSFGLVVTPSVRATFPEEQLIQLESVVRATTPARRLCTCEEVARLVVHLVGDDASWFNGATIDFTGGESHAFFDTLIHHSTVR